MELLAPAGEWESLQAALAAGADAVYLGGKTFSARQSAANFDGEQLKMAADLVHLHGKKIYVTVNTLIHDKEMPAALDFLTELYHLGIDAVIVQDLGLIHLARKYIPQLPLHASTQMTVHNSQGASFLKTLGLNRIVLARELSAFEVKTIVERSAIEVEVFIHGALCVCYSGQCLMSSIIGGRSGNRGRCAQPCRLEYQLYRDQTPVAGEGTFLLSPKDLALIGHLPELDSAGVRSLKIEGRMKRPEYVYAVTRTYRQALDRYYEDPLHYQVEPQWLDQLEQTFNRGFTSGYFGGIRNKPLMSYTRPNNRGIFAGRIKAVASSQIILRLDTELAVGDEVEIWVKKGGRVTAVIHQLLRDGQTVNTAYPDETVSFHALGKVYPGDRVFKIFSQRLAVETKAAIDPSSSKWKLPLRMEVFGRLHQPLQLTCVDETGHQIQVRSELDLQPAINRPLTPEVLHEQLNRLGASPFYLKELRCNLQPGVMLPISALNQLRRQAVDGLVKQKLKSYHRPLITSLEVTEEMAISNSANTSPRQIKVPLLSVWVADLDSLREAALAGADLIYAGGDELTGYHWDSAAFKRAASMAHEAGARFVLGTPRINREDHRSFWEKYPEYANDSGADGVIVSEPGMLQLMLEATDLPVYLNYPLNFFNHWSSRFLAVKRIIQFTASPELTLAQLQDLGKWRPAPNMEWLVHGPLELMVSEYCPIHSLESGTSRCATPCRNHRYFLQDRLKFEFPVVTDGFCRMHLLNSKDLCLYGELHKLMMVAPFALRLELKVYPPSTVAMITNAYHFALRCLSEGRQLPDSDGVIAGINRLTGRGITKGHYFRGVD